MALHRSILLATVLAAAVAQATAQNEEELPTQPSGSITTHVAGSAFSDEERLAMSAVARAMRDSGLKADMFSDFAKPKKALPPEHVYHFRRAFKRLPKHYSASSWELALIKVQRAEASDCFRSPEQSKVKIASALEEGDLASAYDELMALSSRASAPR